MNVAEPPTDVPPPDYVPPADASGPHPRSSRRMVVTIAIALVVVVAGYAIAGFTFATSKLDSARTTYNAVVEHQNAITDTVNLFNTKFTTASATAAATASDLKADRSLLDQVVSESLDTQIRSTTDDASLASVQPT